MSAIDRRPLYKKYKGLWVSLEKDEVTVIASGKTIEEVMEKSRKKGFDKPILTHIPKKFTYFIGSIL